MKMMLGLLALLILPQAVAQRGLIPGVTDGEDDDYTEKDLLNSNGKLWVTKTMVKAGQIRCTDSNTGSGFIMYSEQPLNDRFNEDKNEADFRKNSAENFVCVRYKNARWEYDNNWEDEEQRASNISWHAFIPKPTDVLMAIVDFSADRIHVLNATDKFKQFKGMAIGWALGDLGFYPDLDWQGNPDDGEFRINGTYFVEWPNDLKSTIKPKKKRYSKVVNGTIYQPVTTGNMRCTDSNTGPGFIMYSKKDVNLRWNLDKTEVDFRSHSAQNFVCVRYNDNNWWYDTNWQDEVDRAAVQNVSWHIFMPEPTDVLVASVDYTDDKVMDLKASNLTYKGIKAGYKDGDLVYFADQAWDGTADDGEFRISGDYIAFWPEVLPATTTTTTTTTTGTTTTPIYLQPNPSGQDLLKLSPVNREVKGGVIRCGNSRIASGKEAIPPGFIMYSKEDVIIRFGSNPVGKLGIDPRKHTATHLVCVRFWQDRWQYDSEGYDNGVWHNFEPVDTDVAIAAVDPSSGVIKLTKGVRARSYGMQIGYVTGSVGIVRNKYKMLPKGSQCDFMVTGGIFQSWGTGH